MTTDNTKVSANRQKKETIVAEIAEKVGKSKAMVFTNYAGLTHQQLEGFKREIRKSDAEFAVAKNTLLKRALGDKVAGEEDKFIQSTGTIFMYGDIVAPLKALAKMMKDFEKPEVKFGLLDGKVITDKDVAKLATLPSREVLIAQMLGMMNAPIQGFHRALSWNLQKFVMTLSAVTKKKETMTSAAPTSNPTPAAEPVEEVSSDAKAMDDKQPEAAAPVSEPANDTPETPAVEETAEAQTTDAPTIEETPAAESTEPTAPAEESTEAVQSVVSSEAEQAAESPVEETKSEETPAEEEKGQEA